MKKSVFIVKRIAVALSIWLFLCGSMSAVYPNIYSQQDAGLIVFLVTVLQRCAALLGDFSILKEAAFIAILILSFKITYNKGKLPIIFKVLAVVLSGLYLFSESFYHTDSAAYIFGDVFMFVVSLIRGIGIYILLCLVFSFIVNFSDKNGIFKKGKKPWSFLKTMLILLVFWLPCLIALYPGGYLLDTQIQLKQFFGYEAFTNAHPPFNTLFVGIMVKLGNAVGSPTLGLFLCTLIQFIVILVTVSYGTWFVIGKLKSEVVSWCMVLFGATTSMFIFYASCIGKDAIYSCCLLMMSVSFVQLYDAVTNGKPFGKLIICAANFSLFSLLAALTRHNGIYIAVPMALLIFVYLFKAMSRKRNAFYIFLISLSGAFLFVIISKIIYPAIGVGENSQSLLYVNMLQHTARFCTEYPDEVSPEDIEIISRIADIDNLIDHYDPTTSDGVKTVSDLNASDADIKAFEKVWLGEIKAHPTIILSSAYNMVYGFMAPVAENTVNDFGEWFYVSDLPKLSFEIPFFITGIRHLYESVLYWWVRLPGERLLQNPGLYSWILLFGVCYVIYKRKYAYLIPFVPGIISFFTYAITPSYFGHSRYSFPMVYATVLYIGICILISRDNLPANAEGEE